MVPDRRQAGTQPTVFFAFNTKYLCGIGVGSPFDADSQQPPVSWLTQSSAVAKITGLRPYLCQPQALTRRINSAQRSSTGKVFSADSGGNVVTTRSTPMSR